MTYLATLGTDYGFVFKQVERSNLSRPSSSVCMLCGFDKHNVKESDKSRVQLTWFERVTALLIFDSNFRQRPDN